LPCYPVAAGNFQNLQKVSDQLQQNALSLLFQLKEKSQIDSAKINIDLVKNRITFLEVRNVLLEFVLFNLAFYFPSSTLSE